METVAVTVERILAAPPEALFKAWVEPELLSKWMFGPAVRNEEIVNLANHLEVNGRFSYIIKRDGKEFNHVGKYLVIEPFSRLSFTWGIEGISVDESVVDIHFYEAEGGCRLVLKHKLDVAWAEYAGRTQQGWTFMIGKLNGVYLAENDIPRVTAQMLVRKPAMDLYNAFIDPAITTHFWFTKSSGALEAGKSVTWQWEMYGVSAPVYVREVIPGRKIALDWGEPFTCVDFHFQAVDEGSTYVVINEYGYNLTGTPLLKRVADSTGGFTTVLDGLKAYLEHGIVLNLIADKFPVNIVSHGKRE